MATFLITPDTFKTNRDYVTCTHKNLRLTVIHSSLEPRAQLRAGNEVYLVVFSSARTTLSVNVILGNADLPAMASAWSIDLMIEALKYYGQVKQLGYLAGVRNLKTGDEIYTADGSYADEQDYPDDIYPDAPDGW